MHANYLGLSCKQLGIDYYNFQRIVIHCYPIPKHIEIPYLIKQADIDDVARKHGLYASIERIIKQCRTDETPTFYYDDDFMNAISKTMFTNLIIFHKSDILKKYQPSMKQLIASKQRLLHSLIVEYLLKDGNEDAWDYYVQQTNNISVLWIICNLRTDELIKKYPQIKHLHDSREDDHWRNFSIIATSSRNSNP